MAEVCFTFLASFCACASNRLVALRPKNDQAYPFLLFGCPLRVVLDVFFSLLVRRIWRRSMRASTQYSADEKRLNTCPRVELGVAAGRRQCIGEESGQRCVGNTRGGQERERHPASEESHRYV